MIRPGGWELGSVFDNSFETRELYRRRARREAEEMTCAAQAAELLADRAGPGESVLDVGCATGWFVHSLRDRGIDVEYYGIDASAALIEDGRRELAPFGVEPERLQCLRIDDLAGSVDHVVCVNVLTNLANLHRPLQRLLRVARKSVILRESLAEAASCSYVRDDFLDAGADIWVYVNTYAFSDVEGLAKREGFAVQRVVDRRTRGEPELVIGHPHHWWFLVAEREGR